MPRRKPRHLMAPRARPRTTAKARIAMPVGTASLGKICFNQFMARIKVVRGETRISNLKFQIEDFKFVI